MTDIKYSLVYIEDEVVLNEQSTKEDMLNDMKYNTIYGSTDEIYAEIQEWCKTAVPGDVWVNETSAFYPDMVFCHYEHKKLRRF